MKKIDMLGQKFGRLVVIESRGLSPSGCLRWACRCDCGKETVVLGRNLRRGHTTSCGCLRLEIHTLEKGLASKRHIFRVYQHNAQRKGYLFDLSFDQFIQICERPCKYCGALPTDKCYFRKTNGVFVHNGIDREDNSKGYVLENCIPCCHICNNMKKNLSVKEFVEHARRISLHCAPF